MPKVKDQKVEVEKAQREKEAAAAAAKAEREAKKTAKATGPAVPPGGKILQDDRTKVYPGGFLVLDAEGYALNKKGQRDTRWHNPFEEAQNRSKSSGGGTGLTKAQRMEKIFGAPGEITWRLDTSSGQNGKNYSNEGVKSATGANLKEYYIIFNADDPKQRITVGKGEMEVYGRIARPAAERGKRGSAKDNPELNQLFDEPEGAQDADTGDSEGSEIDIDAELARP